MLKNKILVVWSNYYTDLATQQLDHCLHLLNQAGYQHTVERVEAGTYEIPAVIQQYHQHHPYDGYLPLGLLLKGSTDHYEFILDHLKACFTTLTLDGLLIGNGIISAPNLDCLTERVNHHERTKEAIRALRYLIGLKEKIKRS